MPVPTTRGSTSRFLAAVLGALLLTAPAAATSATDAPSEESLCDAVDLGALDALGPLRFDVPQFGSPFACSLVSVSGSHTLDLVLSGISFEMMRTSSPDLVEMTVADQPAALVEGYLHVSLEEGVLSITLTPVDPDTAVEVDPVAYSIGVAELVMPALDVPGGGDAEATMASSLRPPPDVAGISWRSGEVVSGTELLEADEMQSAWQPLLDMTGLEATQLFFIESTATDAETNERLGTYSAIQLVGTDEASLPSAIIEWVRLLRGDDVVAEDATIGGKDVAVLMAGGELAGYLYVSGDVAFALTMPEENAASVLELLP